MTVTITPAAGPSLSREYPLAGILIIWLFFASCAQPEPPAVNDNNGPQEYPVYTVQNAPATLKMNYPASLQGEQNIEIRPKIDGYLQQLLVDEGASVKKGQLLFVIHAPQYEQEARMASATISSAQSEVGAARLQISNLTPLVQKGIITASAMDAAQYTLQAKEAMLAQARASLANARTNIGYTQIVSPVDGVLGTIPNKIGSLVSPSALQPLTTVSNIKNIYAYFSFDEKEFLAFASKYSGQTIQEKLTQMPQVTLILPDGSVYPEKGRIETANGVIDPSTGAASLRATFPNPLGLIRSGGTATLEIPVHLSAALLLPQQATFEMQGKKMVYVVDAKGMVKSREIEVMELGAGNNYVVQKGLQAGDKVVAEGMGSLKDSVVIKPVPAKAISK